MLFEEGNSRYVGVVGAFFDSEMHYRGWCVFTPHAALRYKTTQQGFMTKILPYKCCAYLAKQAADRKKTRR